MKNKKLITIITASIAGVILLAIALPLAFGSRSAKRETARPVSDDTSSQARYVNSEAAMDMGGDYYTAETTLPDYYLDYDYEDDSAYYAAEYVEGANGGFNNTTSLYDPAAPAADGFTQLAESESTPSKLIRTMMMTVETVDFERIDSDIRIRLNSMGGYFQDSSVSGTGNVGDARRGYYVIRIPADRLDEFVSYFGTNCTILSQSESTRDVTLDYVDTQSRISSLRTEMEVLTGMLEDCEDLDNLIVLQSRITEIRYEIENYESQLRTVDNQVDYSTLTLTLNEVTIEQEPEPIKEYTFGEKVKMAYKEGLEDLSERWKNSVIDLSYAAPGILAALAVIVVIGIIVVIILLIVRGCVKRKKAKRAKKAQPANTEDSAFGGKPE